MCDRLTLKTAVIRTLARKWDLFAVVGLLAGSAVYSVYTVTQMTGF